MIDVKPSHIDDAVQINVRESDAREIWRTSLSGPNKAVRRSILASRDVWTARIDGEIICIFGVADVSLITKTGAPWLLGSDLVEEQGLEFLVKTKKYMEKVKVGYDRLMNYVDADNEVSIKWLEWIGFTVGEPVPFGAVGKPFRKFTLEN